MKIVLISLNPSLGLWYTRSEMASYIIYVINCLDREKEGQLR